MFYEVRHGPHITSFIYLFLLLGPVLPLGSLVQEVLVHGGEVTELKFHDNLPFLGCHKLRGLLGDNTMLGGGGYYTLI